MNKWFFMVCIWIVSLIVTWILADFELNKGFNSRINVAFERGVLKGKQALAYAPYVKDSLLATKSLGLNVIEHISQRVLIYVSNF